MALTISGKFPIDPLHGALTRDRARLLRLQAGKVTVLYSLDAEGRLRVQHLIAPALQRAG